MIKLGTAVSDANHIVLLTLTRTPTRTRNLTQSSASICAHRFELRGGGAADPGGQPGPWTYPDFDAISNPTRTPSCRHPAALTGSSSIAAGLPIQETNPNRTPSLISTQALPRTLTHAVGIPLCAPSRAQSPQGCRSRRSR